MEKKKETNINSQNQNNPKYFREFQSEGKVDFATGEINKIKPPKALKKRKERQGMSSPTFAIGFSELQLLGGSEGERSQKFPISP